VSWIPPEPSTDAISGDLVRLISTRVYLQKCKPVDTAPSSAVRHGRRRGPRPLVRLPPPQLGLFCRAIPPVGKPRIAFVVNIVVLAPALLNPPQLGLFCREIPPVGKPRIAFVVNIVVSAPALLQLRSRTCEDK
jgi:hypothetical protein